MRNNYTRNGIRINYEPKGKGKPFFQCVNEVKEKLSQGFSR